MVSIRSAAVVLALCALLGTACSEEEPAAEPVTPTVEAEEGDRVAVEKALVDAVTAEEVYLTENLEYTTDVAELEAAGLDVDPGVALTVVTATKDSYCIEVQQADVLMHIDSADRAIAEGPCP